MNESFRMKIAGAVGEVYPLFESTREYCRPYLTGDDADFSIAVTQEDLELEQEDRIQEALREGIRIRHYTGPYLERAAIQRNFAEHLLRRGTLLFHGSAVAVDGEGYVFTAKCGTGKSTHTRLWVRQFGDRAVMINDDKPFLRITETQVLVCGSPWSGKHGLDTNIEVPLKGICILERGPSDRIRRIPAEEALPMLRQQSYCSLDPARHGEYLKLADALAQITPLWRMECTRDPQAALVAYGAMSAAPKAEPDMTP